MSTRILHTGSFIQKPESMCSDSICLGLWLVQRCLFSSRISCSSNNVSLRQRSDTGCFEWCPCLKFKRAWSVYSNKSVTSSGVTCFSTCSWISHLEHNCWDKQIGKMSSNCNKRIVTDCSFLVYWLLIEGDTVLCFPSEGRRHFEHPAQ